MEAAFFDLDKTVLARPSMMAFAPAFFRAGLLRRRSLLQGAASQLVYLRWGAGPRRVARIQRSVLSVTCGWEQSEVRRLVGAGIGDAVDPITYAQAVTLIAEHRAGGRRIVLVSAAPEEIVEPIGARLGVDTVIASRAALDERGRYSGRMERYAYGPAKAELVEELARREGIDLAASWAYSDSVTDLPMLEAVGHPVAVNPDRALRRVALMRGWEVARFELRPDPEMEPGTSGSRRWRPASATGAVLAAAALSAWWARRRG
ncbi:MAG: HAD-IB family hydrolase [Actinomycetota bacterium]|nr:HAD-IB family hydrolase [Actinomycetota bacterium]